MNNNKKPSEPLEPERWALENVPTAQLVEELVSRDGVEAESKRFCRSAKYAITLQIYLTEEECPSVLQ